MTTQYDIRPVHAHEWREIKALRLRALSDEAAPMAFLESFAEAATRPDEFWQDRARAPPSRPAQERERVSSSPSRRTATGWAPPSAWAEKAGDVDFEGAPITRTGGHLVGVFLSPDNRGQGVLGRLFQAVTDWLRESGLDHVRLYVHADNIRAQRSNEKLGFQPTGKHVSGPNGSEIQMAAPCDAGSAGHSQDPRAVIGDRDRVLDVAARLPSALRSVQPSAPTRGRCRRWRGSRRARWR